jgi:beta-alanine degradation protein BauB
MTSTHGSASRIKETLVATNFEGWSQELRAEFAANAANDQVGAELLSETDRVKVWLIRLSPGQRWPAHQHGRDYFWTAVTSGTSEQHTEDGTTTRVDYAAGATRHFAFIEGHYMVHDLCNIGDTPLVFVTVEHKS